MYSFCYIVYCSKGDGFEAAKFHSSEMQLILMQNFCKKSQQQAAHRVKFLKKHAIYCLKHKNQQQRLNFF